MRKENIELELMNTIQYNRKGKSTQDIYDEYIWVNDDFEHIGSTAVDLTGYVQTSQMKPITNQEIDEMFT